MSHARTISGPHTPSSSEENFPIFCKMRKILWIETILSRMFFPGKDPIIMHGSRGIRFPAGGAAGIVGYLYNGTTTTLNAYWIQSTPKLHRKIAYSLKFAIFEFHPGFLRRNTNRLECTRILVWISLLVRTDDESVVTKQSVNVRV